MMDMCCSWISTSRPIVSLRTLRALLVLGLFSLPVVPPHPARLLPAADALSVLTGSGSPLRRLLTARPGRPPQYGDGAISPAASSPLPLAFEVNRGQASPDIRFLARTGDAVLLLHRDGSLTMLMAHRGGARGTNAGEITLHPLGARRTPLTLARLPLPGRVNYLIGNTPAAWHVDIPTYRQVEYRDVYPGIDLLDDGGRGQLELSWIVRPGADPTRIRLAASGTLTPRIDGRGKLRLAMAGSDILWDKPHAYQLLHGARVTVRSEFRIEGGQQLAFDMGPYDRHKTLVIDPVLRSSLLVGGNGLDVVNALAVDGAGNTYLAGVTNSLNLATQGAVQPVLRGGGGDTPLSQVFGDAFVTKLNARGTAIVYSTYLGGSMNDWATHIAVDGAGCAFVMGATDSADFPTAPGSLRPTVQWSYSFVAKLSLHGDALLYSTYLPGSHVSGASMTVDSRGDAFITGEAGSGLPLVHALQRYHGGGEAFVMRLNPPGNRILFSTFLGGSGEDVGMAIAVDDRGNMYVAGYTTSTDFPLSHAFQTKLGGDRDAFIAKLSANGRRLVYSSYLGGEAEDDAFSVAADAAGNAYLTGETWSSHFHVRHSLQGALNLGENVRSPGGVVPQDAFAAKIGPSGSLIYSTYLGGTGVDAGWAIAGDAAGNAYVAGMTMSRDLPIRRPLAGMGTPHGQQQGFIIALGPSGRRLLWSGYIGGKGADRATGIGLDHANNLYIAGTNESPDFPASAVLLRGSPAGEHGFVLKIQLSAP